MTNPTAVFIDYDNLYRSINESYSMFITSDVVKKLLDYLSDEQLNSVQLVKAFCDFKTSSNEISDLQENLVELRHVNSIGDGKSNASDIALAIDVTKSLSNNRKFEHYVIVSSDSDMLPLILELRYQGKEITLLYLESKIKNNYLETLEKQIKVKKIEEILGVETYKPFNIENLEFSNEEKFKYLNCINKGMNDLYVKYGSKSQTVVYQKDLLAALNNQSSFNLQPSDSSAILDYFKKEKIIIAAEVKVIIKDEDQKRTAFFINEDKLEEFDLTLDDEVMVKYREAELV
ncbi:hypothetical protein AS034_19065 [[Bacillus] enclensis]|uniref:Uncharacterized conserved protein, LabA/DUF88 family n=1 Tax=[Bacillus] enclensis TaxID=1402860 RepID=A0A0V8H9E7_9BACI|nr:NYN domain-containing protein [[Bacillus] enclensis]KSU59060.1 hypothetical protein AS034_19065 [[Bacillus] enclensis]SCC31920.1 Uncharacterized conserved protein, LabA/DUF88 family [[Bacillus] enclensis]